MFSSPPMPPGPTTPMPVSGLPGQQGGQPVSFGLVQARPLRLIMDEEREHSQAIQAAPLVTGLAGYIRHCWSEARMAKDQNVTERMLQSVRARRGEYDPEKLQQIRSAGGAEIYMMLTSVKCRAAGSWLRDILLAAGEDRPWSIDPSANPTLTPMIHDSIVQAATQPIKDAMTQGVPLSEDDIRQIMLQLKSKAEQQMREAARAAADEMADKMEDQLVEGGFLHALDQFIDDLTTFPSAVLKGPIIRKKNTLTWAQDQGGNYAPQVQAALVIEWERVSPFNCFPSPAATNMNDGYFIEKHRLSRTQLREMIDVPGYDNATIHVVLADFGTQGLHEWATNDFAQAAAEGKSTVAIALNTESHIDAIQFWGSVQGQMLLDWGLDESQVPDVTKEYDIEAWLIGPYIIKAALVTDPLARKTYYKASYEDVPGSWWGNSVADLVRDAQQVVNASARAMVNNMGMASGPQVAVNVDRLPPGENISQIVPWKIWQVNGDAQTGQTGQPVQFFQPESHVAELMTIFEKFSELADEYSGIPRYLSGDTSGGAGRTASGLSMLVNNAGKSIKQVVSNVDMDVIDPVLQQLYTHNMLFGDDPALKGDVNIRAHGADTLIAKESAQVRRNEFLAATGNPIDMQIIGLDGRGAVLREVAKGLDMDVDKIVPQPDILKQKSAEWAAQQQQLAQAQIMRASGGPQGVAQGGGVATPPALPGMPGNAGSLPNPTINGQQLQNGAPVTDNFSPAGA